MPLVRTDPVEGRSEEQIGMLLTAVHRVGANRSRQSDCLAVPRSRGIVSVSYADCR